MKRLAWLVMLLSAGPALALAAASGFDWRLPPGVAPPPVPADNPMSEAKVELGRRLFYDADLSIDGTESCATCHGQHRAFSEGNATHPGVNDSHGRRNVMSLTNVAYFAPLTWADPWRVRLENQMLVPLFGQNPVEMGMAGQPQTLVERLKTDDCYRNQFDAAFPQDKGEITLDKVTKAIASFERTLISFDSPYDRFQRGQADAISPQAKRGAALFSAKGLDCASCHSGPNFTDADRGGAMALASFHNIGLYNQDGFGAYPEHDHGLGELTLWPDDEGKIRTPGLRNVALTGPYMHDGSIKTLAEAVQRHYGPGLNPLRDPRLRRPGPTADETADLVAFLESLTDQGFVTDPRFSLPKTACGRSL